LKNHLFVVSQADMHANKKVLNMKSEQFIVFVDLHDEKSKNFKKNSFAP
jgi:hypothetical protein